MPENIILKNIVVVQQFFASWMPWFGFVLPPVRSEENVREASQNESSVILSHLLNNIYRLRMKAERGSYYKWHIGFRLDHGRL